MITSKSISKNGGRAGYRGLLEVAKGATGAKSKVVCDALILDEESRSDTYPYILVDENDVDLGHRATVSKIGEEQLFYLMSRGLSESEASAMIVSGFVEPITKAPARVRRRDEPADPAPDGRLGWLARFARWTSSSSRRLIQSVPGSSTSAPSGSAPTRTDASSSGSATRASRSGTLRSSAWYRPQANSIVLLQVDDVASARVELEAKDVPVRRRNPRHGRLPRSLHGSDGNPLTLHKRYVPYADGSRP